MSAGGRTAACQGGGASSPSSPGARAGDAGAPRGRVGGTEPRGRIRPNSNYGRVTSIALDPVEKKPLALWRPGSYVLSVGSYGCNLRCPFCQNWQISQAGPEDVPWRYVSPEELVDLALEERSQDGRVVGIAYTYNEPLVGWEYVRDCARLARERGLANVLVSNGHASDAVLDELAPLVDAANIDLKAFDEPTGSRGPQATAETRGPSAPVMADPRRASRLYTLCGGSQRRAMRTIERLAAEPGCHLEVTTLVIPGLNDAPEQMDAEAAWLASVNPGLTLHVTRFFPRWRMQDVPPTPVETVRSLAGVARRHLAHVYVGNC